MANDEPETPRSPDQSEGREHGNAIRVVICDDSPFMRRMLRQGLERARDIEVVGSAANAREGIELCNTMWPDILILDLELPDIDGIRVLQHVRGMPVRVIVVSTFTTERSSERAVEALAEGAVDCLGKPSLDTAPSVFFAELLDRVREVAAGAPYVSPARVTEHGTKALGQRLIVIGASTGGPRALHAVLPGLPPDFPAPIVVVQHMPPNFSAPFSRRLDDAAQLTVREAWHGALLKPGTIYVASAGRHLHIEGQQLGVRPGPRVNGLIPAVDVTMIDAAASWGDRVTAIVLTGIGSDGREGARAIRTAGGRVLAEHRSTCAVYGMPKSVIEAGLADLVVPIDELAQRMMEEVYE